MRLAGVTFLALTGVVILFHLALIFGARWGHLTMGGRWTGALPMLGRVVSGVSILCLGGIGWTVAQRAGIMAQVLPPWTMWLAVAYLGLGAIANAVTPSAAERMLWLPVILAMLAAALWVMRG